MSRITHHTLTLHWHWCCTWWSQCGFSTAQKCMLCTITFPWFVKVANRWTISYSWSHVLDAEPTSCIPDEFESHCRQVLDVERCGMDGTDADEECAIRLCDWFQSLFPFRENWHEGLLQQLQELRLLHLSQFCFESAFVGSSFQSLEVY